jgi:hypothetical protein
VEVILEVQAAILCVDRGYGRRTPLLPNLLPAFVIGDPLQGCSSKKEVRFYVVFFTGIHGTGVEHVRQHAYEVAIRSLQKELDDLLPLGAFSFTHTLHFLGINTEGAQTLGQTRRTLFGDLGASLGIRLPL